MRFAESAAADLGLGAQQANALAAWMSRFQQRPKQGEVVLADESNSETHGEATLTGEQLGDAYAPEHLQDVRFQFHPAGAYTDEGELRVYTQSLVRGAHSARQTRVMVRYAVHVRLASCMDPLDHGENGKMHTAVVICQHHDGSCDARLIDDLATTVRSVHAQLSNATLDADAHARVSEYDSDTHQADNLHTESGAHVSRHATLTARIYDGAAGGSARSHNDD